ncbi:MAG: hypothetical protein GYB65_11360 [Chloroflexi bacterium]|nr:hypothetical protein [Chloroflexota bacterium]
MTESAANNEVLQEVHQSVLEGLGQLASYFGFNKIMGQLFGALLLSPMPLSLDDLMEPLSISKASVSTNMRTLEHMGVVREVWVKDDRRKYYEAEHDLWQVLTNVLSSRELRDVNRALAVLEEDAESLRVSLPKMSDQHRTQAEFYVQKVEQLQQFFRLAQLILLSVIEQAKSEIDLNGITRVDFE